MLGDAQLEELAADIKTNGIITPIVLRAVEGGWEVLDGRNRLTAAELAGIDLFMPDGKLRWAYFRTVGGDSAFDPFAFVISANLHRRHLNESQRAMVATKLANLKKGGAGGATVNSDTAIAVSQPDAAKLLNVSVDSVQRAGTVLREGSPELVKQVERGEVSVSAAAKTIRADKIGPKEAQQRPLRDRSASAPRPAAGPQPSPALKRDTAIVELCGWLRGDVKGALEDIVRILRDERSRIGDLPLDKRVIIARGYLQALGVTVDDLAKAVL